MSDNMTIVVNAVIEADLATLEQLREPLLVMQEASRVEAGCLDYTFSVELANPEVIRITERWIDMASLQAHFATPHMGMFQDAMRVAPPRSVTATFFEAVEVPRPGS